MSPTSEQALRYDELWADAYGDMQALGATLGQLDYRSAIDVGCGAGDNAELIAARGPLERFVGVDVSSEALERARRRAPGEYRQLDVQAERAGDEFDLVFSSLLLEHLPDDRAALRNMRAMCGRWLVVSTIAGDFDRYRAWDERVGHVRNYARGELERRLSEAGFELQSTRYWGFPFYSPLMRLLQNRMEPSPRMGRTTRVLAAMLYRLYFFNSHRRGDLLIAVARPV